MGKDEIIIPMSDTHILCEQLREANKYLLLLDQVSHGLAQRPPTLEPWQVAPERLKQYELVEKLKKEINEEVLRLCGEDLKDTFEDLIRDSAYASVW